MFKNMKLAVKAGIIINIALIIGFFSLWKVVDEKTGTIVSENITNQMTDSVKSRTAIIEDYVKSAEDFLVAYGQAQELKDLLNNPESLEYQAIAQKYTEDFAKTKDIFEGIYIATPESLVLAHSVPQAVGIYTRKDAEAKKVLQQTILPKRELTNGGIMISPSSGDIVISMYYPIYDGGSCIGFAGAAVYAKNLMDSLLSLKVEGLLDSEYVFLDVNKGTYLYNEDPKLLCTETTDKGYQEILAKLRTEPTIDVGVHTYFDEKKDEKMVIYCNIPKRGWVFALKDSKSNVYQALATVKHSTANVCVAIGLTIMALTIGIFLGIGKTLNKVRIAITKLGEMDLSAAKDLKKYTGKKDEIGVICDAVTKTCNNMELYIGAVDKQLSCMAHGDYTQTIQVEFIGIFKHLEKSMLNIQNALRKSFQEINTVTSELVIGSNQVADSATQLANAAVNANQLVVEIDNHVNEISDRVSESAQSASVAKQEMEDAIELVSASQEKMNALSEALTRIQTSTSAIKEVSNNMEQIAKQTNILALNALVEASRAGEKGKGFSVVANEIRQLAQESNESAVNAYKLIHETLECVEEGTQIGEETLEYLGKVVNQTSIIDASITSIAEAAKVQDKNLIDVRNSLHTMSQTIETTAGMAQQSAAASNELDGQTNVLKENISKYHI